MVKCIRQHAFVVLSKTIRNSFMAYDMFYDYYIHWCGLEVITLNELALTTTERLRLVLLLENMCV